MSSRHRARHDTIHILRASVIKHPSSDTNAADENRVQRPKTVAYLRTSTKFPITKVLHRPESKRFRAIFKAHRPTTAPYRAVVKAAKTGKWKICWLSWLIYICVKSNVT